MSRILEAFNAAPAVLAAKKLQRLDIDTINVRLS